MTRTIQRGFTLIELVVVITILGILAAFAVPRFLSLDTQARIAATQALGGSVRSAASLAHSYALVTGATGAVGSITMDGNAVSLAFGWPDAAGIQAALQDTTGFTPTVAASTVTFTKTGAAGATPANCKVSYTAAAAAGGSATTTTSGSLATDC